MADMRSANAKSLSRPRSEEDTIFMYKFICIYKYLYTRHGDDDDDDVYSNSYKIYSLYT
jgi:hypothetical protein